MKRKKREYRQLNKNSAIKLTVFIILVVLIELATGFFAFTQFSKHTYRQEYDGYQTECDALAATITQRYSEDELKALESDSALLNSVIEDCKRYSGRYKYVIFSETQGGKIVYWVDGLI